MDEIYRMLGRDHEADLAREADTRRLADEVRRARRSPNESGRAPKRAFGPRLFALVLRRPRPAL
jgi:hypothetical protein